MKKLAIAIAAIALAGTPAFAADMARKMPLKAPPPAPAPVSNWTGLYVGGNAGYGWAHRTVTFTPNDPLAAIDTCGGANGATCPPPTSFNMSGALAGLQVGYNWQFNTNWLAGIEADFDWSWIKDSGSSSFLLNTFAPTPGPHAASFVADQNVNWFGTIRGRLGFLPANNLLVYGTGGFAYARVDENVALNSTFSGNDFGFGGFGFACVAGSSCFVGTSSRTATGWTAGGGFEYALWRNISAKVEYLYVNLGGGDAVNVVAVSANGQPHPSSFTAGYSGTNFNVVRAGINYRFD